MADHGPVGSVALSRLTPSPRSGSILIDVVTSRSPGPRPGRGGRGTDIRGEWDRSSRPARGGLLPLLCPACGVCVRRCRGTESGPTSLCSPVLCLVGAGGVLRRGRHPSLSPRAVVVLRGRPLSAAVGVLSRRPVVLPSPGRCERWLRLGLCGAPGSPRVVPQVPEAERWCRSHPRGPFLRLPPRGLRVGPEEEFSSSGGGVVEAVERGAPLTHAGLRGASGVPPLAVDRIPLPSPGVPERLRGRPDEGRPVGVWERDPPSVRKPSLAIREVCLGVPYSPRPAASLCVVVALP